MANDLQSEEFTFHIVHIKLLPEFNLLAATYTFTFHIVHIKPDDEAGNPEFTINLHST